MIPYTIRGYEYYSQTENDAIPVFYRKQIGSNIEEIILDVNREFRERSFLTVQIISSAVTLKEANISPDGRYLAYSIDTSEEEIYNLYIKDLNTGKVEVIKRNVYSFAFGLNDAHSPEIYYTVANNLMRTNHM